MMLLASPQETEGLKKRSCAGFDAPSERPVCARDDKHGRPKICILVALFLEP